LKRTSFLFTVDVRLKYFYNHTQNVNNIRVMYY
jgi:hypothetical protein